MAREAQKSGAKRGDSTATWAKVKYDRQIIGTAKAINANVIYSEDGDLCSLARSNGLTAKSIADCPLPYTQQSKGPGLFDGE